MLRYLSPIPFMLLLSACGYDYTPTVKEVTATPDGKEVIMPQACPDWRHSATINYDNSAMSNFGCATAVNFGRQLAYPNDLLAGRGNTRAETESAVSTVERFYRGEFVQKTTDFQPVTTE